MNLSTMQSTLSLLLRSTAPDFVNNRLLWLNETQRNICGLGDPWYFTDRDETFSTTLKTFTTVNSYARISALWRTTGINSPLELIPIDIGSETLLASPGASTHYRSGDPKNVVFTPTPDVSYSFRLTGNIYLPDFALPADENVLSIIAPYALIFGAAIEAALHLGRDPALWKARLEEQITILRQNYSKRARSLG